MAFLNLASSTEPERLELLKKLRDWATKPTALMIGAKLPLGERYTSAWAPEGTASSRREDYVKCPSFCSHFPWPAARAPPAGFGQSHDAVYIGQLLRGGPGRNAQVYDASFNAACEESARELVVKIFQPSLSEAVEWLSHCPGKPKTWAHELERCRVEEWAYRQMVALQGIIVRLPHGEDAIAFVMEKIDALSDADWIATSGAFGDDRKEALERVANALISAEHALHSCNVSSVDLASRNVLWPVHRDQHPMPVLIDFDLADILHPSRQADGLYRIICVLSEYWFDDADLREWVKSNIKPGSHLLKMFDIRDKDIAQFKLVLPPDIGRSD
ncbi:hypothetical protein EXIGLDRAFT_766784 [Exidia glandulosa HHB12029]|uniref:Protein kinase domain-containing protein n=1 Tax=Exidia glandulosa HHB12029 TaxID=1314781 RepID=A0A165JF47_EXIGL|nr:hypothetical protein EXIGLDRAFT_766784 [Exidia glandulosa HHB12029]